jgi:hypothetical protein
MRILLISLLLTSCGAVHVKQDFPRPLVPPLDIEAEIYIHPLFESYVYIDDMKKRGSVAIELGKAQTSLFKTMTEHMFSHEAERKVLITPSLIDYQYAYPRQTASEIYEVYVKYRVQVEHEGRPIADWVITGYGKTPSAMLKSRQAALDAATTVALRDVGGQLAVGFKRQAQIKHWLEQ